MEKLDLNNRANQMNPNNIRYWMSRGIWEQPQNFHQVAQNLRKLKNSLPKQALNNRANQLNPNNPAYWKSRGII